MVVFTVFGGERLTAKLIVNFCWHCNCSALSIIEVRHFTITVQ